VEGFAAIVRALHGRELVHILVGDEAMEDAARRRLAGAGVDADRGVDFARIPTNDAWLRDTGPIFVVRQTAAGRERAALDFRFDSWGGKYPPWDLDDAVARRIAARCGIPHFEADFVLEGGSVDGNGRGTILTTESCLLNPNRGPDRSRELLEAHLRSWLGATHVLWLSGGIAGDDTDGHVDDVARFVDAGTVAAAAPTRSDDANYTPLDRNLRRLRGMRDQDGKPLSVIELPMPPPHAIGGLRCPASYANFYLANGVALVPTYGAESDARALAILREVWSDRDVVGVPCEDLVLGLGAVHCLSQQEPSPEA